tara:strand:+ start:34608 stop:36482 length:1875 start_codon:yes stop_codon:yes gene_type:complete
MCGIIGYLTGNKLDKDNIEKKLSKAQSFLKFRGPDNGSRELIQFNDQFVAFVHNRLTIIDLNEKSNQPFYSNSKNTIITYNGEIYNYRQLQKELIVEGCKFRTNSDTEVIINAYEQWGIQKTLEKIDGMFAFGLYDFTKDRLFISRDRFGKKPMYFYNYNSTFIFGSDIRSIKELVRDNLSIDFYAFNYFLSELSTPSYNSIWKEVKKLPPATYLEVSYNESRYVIKQEKYWELKYSNSCNLSFKDIVEKTNFLLSQAVKKRLVADVRVATLLSGGIDSSLVVAKMAELSCDKINTYTVGFKDRDFDESSFARQVAKKFDTNHTEIILDSDLGSIIDNIIYEYGEPFGDSSMIPSYLICNEVSKNEKVVLGGDGGDELFGGYDNYYKTFHFDKWKELKVLKPLVNVLNDLAPSYRINLLNELLNKAYQPYHKFLDRNMGFNQKDQSELLISSVCFNSIDTEHSKIYNSTSKSLKSELLKVMNASFQTRLLNDYLVKVDRASMFASLEMRSPFLDKDLTEFSATLRPSQLYHQGEPKSILKNLARKYFDRSFIYRKKMGFGIPIINWLIHNDLKGFMDVILSPNKYVLFEYAFLEQLINEHISNKKNHQHRLWLIYVFNKWASFN